MTRRAQGEGWSYEKQGKVGAHKVLYFRLCKCVCVWRGGIAHTQSELMELSHKSVSNYRQGSFQGRSDKLIGRASRRARSKHIRLYYHSSQFETTGSFTRLLRMWKKLLCMTVCLLFKYSRFKDSSFNFAFDLGHFAANGKQAIVTEKKNTVVSLNI